MDKLNKLESYKQDYYLFSEKLSNNCRSLAFAGIAIIWIFKQKDGDNFILPQRLWWVTVLIISSLSLDLLHYVYQTSLWGIFHRYHEKKDPDPERMLSHSHRFNWPTLFFMWTKVACVVAAYIVLFLYLLTRFTFAQ